MPFPEYKEHKGTAVIKAMEQVEVKNWGCRKQKPNLIGPTKSEFI